ncbi:biotin-dependent carboxyltransferase family protein [Burkholderia anthina]|uniref:5-oxoprolinase subunit C family protein n=1 Tax=Burkholderia anthina TaxID=179879 RepID=UPI0037C0F499
MTAFINVREPGLHTTVQDRGRFGFRAAGVPVSGPLDRIGLRLANALVGNPDATPALEIMLRGPVLEVAADSVRVALAGCDGMLEIRGEPARKVPAGRSVRLVRGTTFAIATTGQSACGYLAVEGGIDVPAVLGSAATYVRGGLGGCDGRALRAGDRIGLRSGAARERAERAFAQPFDLQADAPVRVVPGPQADYFDAAAFATFIGGEYTVSAQADRMGFRLDGPRIEHAHGFDLVSDGIVSGAIQVPGSGMPIVLMADAQTTGGYPKIATVISADLPVLARRKPGARLRFAAVSVLDAERARRDQENDLRRCVGSLVEVRAHATVDVAALHTKNLVSGVVHVPG